MSIRVCPACQRRWAGVVSPDCDVCSGAGVLTLGTAAVHHEGVEVTSRAVELALESFARFALADSSFTFETARGALRHGVTALRQARILAGATKAPQFPVIARQAIDSATARTLDAPPLAWEAGDRPVAAGIPGFSAAGYISRMARIADPLDFLGPSTAERLQARNSNEQRAARLASIAANY